MKLAFYAYFIGSDNNMAFNKIPTLPSLNYPCYYFTNNTTMFELLKATQWLPVFIDLVTTDDNLESNMAGKHIKSSPHLYAELKDYDYLCYLDNKVASIDEQAISYLIQSFFVEKSCAILLPKHWYIKNHIWNEFAECFNHHRYRLQSDQIIRYIQKRKSEGFNEHFSGSHAATTIILRNMKHPKINEINDTWQHQIQECGIQCQISFFFVRQLFTDFVHVFDEHIFSY